MPFARRRKSEKFSEKTSAKHNGLFTVVVAWLVTIATNIKWLRIQVDEVIRSSSYNLYYKLTEANKLFMCYEIEPRAGSELSANICHSSSVITDYECRWCCRHLSLRNVLCSRHLQTAWHIHSCSSGNCLR